MLPSKFCSPSQRRSRSGASMLELVLVLVLIVCAIGSVWIWQGGVPVGQIAAAGSEFGTRSPLLSVAITPDQQHIFATGLGSTLRTHSLETQELLSEIELEYGSSRCLFSSPTGQQLVVGTVTGHLQIWDDNSKESTPRIFKGHQSEVLCGAFHPGGDFFATCDKAGNCIALSSLTLAPIWMIPNGTGAISALSFSSDGRRLITGDIQGFLKAWDAKTGKLLSAHRVENSPSSPLQKIVAVQSVPNSDDAIVVAMAGPIQLWDLNLGHCKRHFELRPSSSRCLSLSPDGNTLLSGAMDGSISVWNVGSATRLKTWRAHGSAVLDLDFAADGARFVSVGWDGLMNVWPL